MTQRKRTAKASGSSSKQSERLKDEVYRQMYRLEAGRTGSELALALALLRAWISLESEADWLQVREWLMKICPICLTMIEAAQKVCKAERQCIQ